MQFGLFFEPSVPHPFTGDIERRVFENALGQARVADERLRRDPRVSFLVEAGERWAELRAVHLTGRAEVVEDRQILERVAAEMERKFARFRTARAAMPEATRRHYETPFVLLRVVPDAHVISWDNRKLWR